MSYSWPTVISFNDIPLKTGFFLRLYRCLIGTGSGSFVMQPRVSKVPKMKIKRPKKKKKKIGTEKNITFRANRVYRTP